MSRFLAKLKRAFEFAIVGWSNEDYDYGYLLKLMEFKLRRLEKAILNGHAEPDKKTNQSIRICIKLLNKLASNDYMYFVEQHYAKWGEPKINTVDVGNNFSRLEFTYKNVKTPEDKELHRQEFIEATNKDSQQELRDKKLLFSIMEKYMTSWWD